MQNYKNKIKKALNVFKESSRNPISLMWDYWTLRRKKGITSQEYYNYTFDNQTELFRKTFLGRNEQRYYLDYLNPKKYYIIARNKYLSHLLLEENGVPMAQLYCYYSPEGRYNSDFRVSHDLSSTISILKKKDVSQCVIKAPEDSHGNNVFAVKDITYTDDDAKLTLSDDRIICLSSILSKTPLLFEEILHQTPQFEAFNKTSVNTARIMTCLYPDGNARVIAVFLKVGRNGAFVDNAGSGGNVDAGVDVKTGVIYNPVIFEGFRKTTPIEKHPDSQCQLNNVKIDNYEEICDKVCQFQKSVPFLKAIGWDIAITDDGPRVIEINDFWDTTGQLFIQKGWREEIRQCYIEWKDYNSKYGVSYPFERQPNNLKSEHLHKIVDYEFR